MNFRTTNQPKSSFRWRKSKNYFFNKKILKKNWILRQYLAPIAALDDSWRKLTRAKKIKKTFTFKETFVSLPQKITEKYGTVF
jgi:hypothetical protein